MSEPPTDRPSKDKMLWGAVVAVATVVGVVAGMQAALWRVDDKLDNSITQLKTQTAESVSQIQSVANVPIGGVILFYGSSNEIPANYEVCDGTPPVTPGAVFSGNKPMLVGRFPKGAPKDRDVKSNPSFGGSNDMVPHFHSLGTLAATGGDHTHTGGGHEHAVRGVEDDGGDTDTHIAIGDNKGPRDGVKLTGGAHEHGGGSHGHNFTGRVGALTGADGDSSAKGLNQPEFLEMHFIIRVK